MRVLKIVAEGQTTSFRYPHFMQQIHPSYQMPPPATIYGHICSALGTWIDPNGVEFAYHFTYAGIVTDIEHTIMVSSSTGKLPETKYPKVLEGRVNPFDRDIIFQPRLTLYLNQPQWLEHFRSPRYLVVLGRSQDLFTYIKVEVMELQQAEQAYFEHTLLPHQMAVQVMQGVTVLLPRYLDYNNQRAPSFSRYLVVKEHVLSPNFFQYDASIKQNYWIDPTSIQKKGLHLGLYFHSFVGDDGETLQMA
ncbi:MAG: CRISPR-associated protein Cas5 [Anaerolineae bacterium]|nr:CRISPR-associated protein Cas5 [Anaerolineae bacterium]